MAVTGGGQSRKLNFKADDWVREVARLAANDALVRLRNSGALQRLADAIARDVDRQIARVMPVVAGRLVGQESLAHQALEVRPASYGLDEVAGLDDSLTASLRPYFHFSDLNPRVLRGLQAELAAAREGSIATWAPLARATVREKKNRLFFVRTGALREQLKGFDLVSKVGSTRVTVAVPTTGDVRQGKAIGALEIAIFPKLAAAQRAALASDALAPDPEFGLEGALFGYNSLTRRKLKGAAGRTYGGFRPMLQPILHWYLAAKLPLVVQRALARLPGATSP